MRVNCVRAGGDKNGGETCLSTTSWFRWNMDHNERTYIVRYKLLWCYFEDASLTLLLPVDGVSWTAFLLSFHFSSTLCEASLKMHHLHSRYSMELRFLECTYKHSSSNNLFLRRSGAKMREHTLSVYKRVQLSYANVISLAFMSSFYQPMLPADLLASKNYPYLEWSSWMVGIVVKCCRLFAIHERAWTCYGLYAFHG